MGRALARSSCTCRVRDQQPPAPILPAPTAGPRFHPRGPALNFGGKQISLATRRRKGHNARSHLMHRQPDFWRRETGDLFLAREAEDDYPNRPQ